MEKYISQKITKHGIKIEQIELLDKSVTGNTYYLLSTVRFTDKKKISEELSG